MRDKLSRIALAVLLLMVVLPAVSFSERLIDALTAEKCIASILSQNMIDCSGAEEIGSTKAAVVKVYYDMYKQWEVSADKSPINQYRRGTYYFAMGVDTGKDEMFLTALPLLMEANNLDEAERDTVYMPLPRMIRFIEMTEAERITALNKMKADSAAYSDYFFGK